MIISLFAWGTNAQSTDNELWAGYTLRFKLNKKLRFDLEQQTRTNDNFGGLKSAFVETGVKYRIKKWISLKPQWRYTIVANGRNRSRLSLDANLKWEFKKLKLTPKYRMRFQNTTVSYTGEFITILRNQLTLGYNWTKLVDPYVEYENFYRFNFKNETRVHRYTAGLEWKLNKKAALKTVYQVDQEVNVSAPDRQNIVAILFGYSF